MQDSTRTISIIAIAGLLLAMSLGVSTAYFWTAYDWMSGRHSWTCGDFEDKYKPDFRAGYIAVTRSFLAGNKRLDGSRGAKGVPCESLKNKADAQQ